MGIRNLRKGESERGSKRRKINTMNHRGCSRVVSFVCYRENARERAGGKERKERKKRKGGRKEEKEEKGREERREREGDEKGIEKS